ncbi:hypothetical protein IP86_16420 [Rhodopseudomonas sp. AAP120]|uniref:YwqG family protein n=1 Tax=Rhodopseudomonas sp. AAP120 TaxID=1523430 RepID=UPI0006B9CA9A|nr:YwqG family protein [Rhodopseudomonas sp. AAP120]KPF96471.1 hypothetical protein IP86_16420 [Rhodopseudomonas sp. AAP120]
MADLETMDDAALIAVWLDNLRSDEQIDHVGAYNRRFRERAVERSRIVQVLLRRGGGSAAALRQLLEHADPAVARAAAQALKQPDGAPPAQTLTLPPEHPAFWMIRNPPPPALSAAEIAHRLSKVLPDQADALLRWLRPAIGLWPHGERPDAPADGSRLGGMPYAPPDWTWPVAAGEPMLFIGQINCADVHGMLGAESLPDRGLLSFFADHDTAMGCLLTGQGGAAYYWPDTADLVAAKPPLEILTRFARAELLFRPMFDLPDPKSSIVAAILPDRAQLDIYERFRREMIAYGSPEDWDGPGGSKLFGWPDLLQDEDFTLTLNEPFSAYQLLLQLDSYTNGQDFVDWGPGGYLYYFVTKDDFADQRWDAAELAMQCT